MTTATYRAAILASLLCAVLPACGSPATPMTDQERCEQACTKLVGCGVQYDGTCAAGCLASSVFLSCVKQGPAECNDLALCAFRQYAATFCGGVGGVPAGAGSCSQGATCEGTCNAMSAPASCACGCVAQVAAGKALSLLINNQCSIARCPVDCGPTGSGPRCNACFAQACAAQSAQCGSN